MAEEKRGGKAAAADFLFEVSWEVCNKVGGIYTVIKTKVPQALKRYEGNYILIGPYFHNRVKGEFEETVAPDHCKAACEELRSCGIVVHYGHWLTEGNPTTILIDFQPLFAIRDEIKTKLWELYRIDSLHSGFEFDEPVVWGWAVGMVIERFSRLNPDKRTVATFHEWLSGSAVSYLKSKGVKVGTVFVTHATVVGRSLANAGIDIYHKGDDGFSQLEKMDFDKVAYERNVYSKHQLEKAAAHVADVFATVSDITGLEATYILKKSPRFLVPNGLNIADFPSVEENSIMHKALKEKIFHFLLYYFFPHYNLDIENTLIYFTACRYEFRDKGIDVFIKALAKLNAALKEEEVRREIVVFLWVPTGVRGVKPEVIENRTMFKDIEESMKDNAAHIMWHLLSTLVAEGQITRDAVFDTDLQAILKRKVLRFKREGGAPPLCTHDLVDPNDAILRALEENGITNSAQDRVKVIFYPIYLTGADGILDLTYYEAMQGSHLGVFPSFYEPWGYTPLEAGALGVTAITSDLAGFGRHILRSGNKADEGIFVLKRMDRNDDEVIESLFRMMYFYALLPKNKRVENKFEARKLANLTDWEKLIDNYIVAQDEAVHKVFGN